MRVLFFFLFSLSLLSTVKAQVHAKVVDMVPANWEVPDGAVFEAFDNRKTLLLKSGRAEVKDLVFTNGKIEVDVYAKSARSFAGITFRKQGGDMEESYMRLHKTTQVDAVQYTPIFNDESNWQLYSAYQAKVEFKRKGWNTLRIDVQGQRAEIYVNNEKAIVVDELRTGNTEGGIGLWALLGNRFSNLRVTPGAISEMAEPVSKPAPSPAVITTWNITEAFPYEAHNLDFEVLSKAATIAVKTEASGLLPISKFRKKSSAGGFEQNKEDYIVASLTIEAEKQETQLFSFDYSDKIVVFLNGQPIFRGSNAFRQKGVQYMGHLDIDTNQLYLPLKKGKNTLHCVIIDKANGWGLMGKLE